MNRLVSIIIPCYNGAPFLRDALDSALRQTVPPSEVILVDDGSTDDSAAIAEAYGPPVRVIRQDNQGESVARNAGLAAARSNYVVFLDADDVLDSQLLEAQLQRLEGVPNGIACTGFAMFFEDARKSFGATMPRADRFFPAIISGNLGPPSCWMRSKEITLQAGCFHPRQRYFEDWDLNWRCAVAGATFVPVPIVGFYYRQHERSQMIMAKSGDRAYGHAWLMERMCREFLDHDDLLNAYADALFWSSWSALNACRGFGVSWDRLQLLCNVLEEVVRREPAGLRRSAFVRTIRWIGVRRAHALRGLRNADSSPPFYRPSWLPAAQK
jgi:glycosyltransferase involved in cell wall biosynthesis